jgi:hypothetical protein
LPEPSPPASQIDESAGRAQAAEYARQSSVREIYHESQKVIERPVFRNVCIDATGVSLLDRSAAIANAEGLGQPSGPAAGTAEPAAQ